VCVCRSRFDSPSLEGGVCVWEGGVTLASTVRRSALCFRLSPLREMPVPRIPSLSLAVSLFFYFVYIHRYIHTYNMIACTISSHIPSYTLSQPPSLSIPLSVSLSLHTQTLSLNLILSVSLSNSLTPSLAISLALPRSLSVAHNPCRHGLSLSHETRLHGTLYSLV
jgi:hypothetical protein